MRGFLEFFAGGGMARLGLGPRWRCLFANDFDAAKCAAYRANFGGADLVEADIASLAASDLPRERADLAWASFPCQDLSLTLRNPLVEIGAGICLPFTECAERNKNKKSRPAISKQCEEHHANLL